jgi:hypothetical protein
MATSSVQWATLIAAGVSALGSTVTGISTFMRFRRETAAPALTVVWTKDGAVLNIRNRSQSKRTIYRVCVRVGQFLQRTDLIPPEELEGTGPIPPFTLEPGERARWDLPYDLIKTYLNNFRWWQRWLSPQFLVELGERDYVKPVPIIVRVRAARAKPAPSN